MVKTSNEAIADAQASSPVIRYEITNVSHVAIILHVIVFNIERLGVLVFTITILLQITISIQLFTTKTTELNYYYMFLGQTGNFRLI